MWQHISNRWLVYQPKTMCLTLTLTYPAPCKKKRVYSLYFFYPIIKEVTQVESLSFGIFCQFFLVWQPLAW
jgi:hypothetical protein